MGNARRAHRRYDVRTPIWFSCPALGPGGRHTGITMNVSAGGALFRSERALSPGTAVVFGYRTATGAEQTVVGRVVRAFRTRDPWQRARPHMTAVQFQREVAELPGIPQS